MVDTFPILDLSIAETAKRVLSEMPHITDQTYYTCLEEFRGSNETSHFQKFAQHMNTPARIEQWCAFYAHENNRDTEILDRYLDVAEYVPQQSASQILLFLVHFYQQQPNLKKTSQLLHAFASLCGSAGNFPTFVVEFAIQVLEQERENKESFWGEQLAYFLSIYDAHTYADDIVYFLDHPIERHHYTAYAILPIAIKNRDKFPNKIIDKIFLYGLFDGLFNPNFSHTADFFDFLKMMNPQHLKQFEPTFQNALQNFINDSEDFLVDAINDILPILSYLKKQNIDLKQEIKMIIEKVELFYNEDISEFQPTQSMDEILAATKADLIKQGLSDEEAELELQQSMLIMKQLFGVNEDQSLEEKFAQNDLQSSETTEEEDPILLQLKQLIN
ncbi:hypothetical protein [Acinetobacter sp. CFCC 10889]|uniref:hypothetical protein n=1 Tax=Acinetobacter sp. CFCC 10889 TaxID=1775557 RepID=UPI0013A6D5C3|nr:hypothetical protein [Acinetobacter sp. CFCC 10889]